MKRCACCIVTLFLVGPLAGCGDAKQAVTGTVTLDGQPVAAGAITFVKVGGDLVREGALIKDGRFEAHVPPGVYKIQLNARTVVGKRQQRGFNGEMEELELTEELFPDRYNTNTELTEEIKSGGNAIKLDLKSAK